MAAGFTSNTFVIWRKEIPELMRGIGRGVREFNDAKSNVRKEIEEGMKEDPEAKK